MPKLSDLSAADICSLRLKCVEAFIVIASKLDIVQEQVFVKGENLYQHCIKGLDGYKKLTP